jgi:bisphosphoglycerate-independent phosphoglycerate mutase (AlkP superfamily)
MVKRLNSQPVKSSVSSKIILLFIDGVGFGANNPDINPCSYSETGIFHINNNLPHSGHKYAIDAQMGIPGLPQSATGHTSLYTGINAPKFIGKHLTGFPNKELRGILKKYSIFVQLQNEGYKCKFLNAFRPVFFTTPEVFANLHMSATTEMNRYAGYNFASFNDIKNEKALYHDYTNKENIQRGFDLPSFSAEKAADILIQESEKYNLILYEYFLTDFAGHAQNMKRSIAEIRKVENLIIGVVTQMDTERTVLIVVSDHGNIEDIRTKSHTTNPAFLGIWDKEHSDESHDFRSLKDLFPFIYFKVTREFPDLPKL